jgi:hypothetical protein
VGGISCFYGEAIMFRHASRPAYVADFDAAKLVLCESSPDSPKNKYSNQPPKNLSKFACQAPAHPKLLPDNDFRLHVSYLQSAILKTDGKKPRREPGLSLCRVNGGRKHSAIPYFAILYQ